MDMTTDGGMPSVHGDEQFFRRAAWAMAGVIVAGFLLQLAAGRSSFGAPPLVHAHAIVFMGWVAIYVVQTQFATRGQTELHRRLGWISLGWIAAMIISGVAVTVAMVRRGGVPFFFRPAHFLIFDPATLIGFVALVAAAIALRRHTDWHRRLHLCAMATLLGPGFGRLLPMPLIQPWAWEASFAAGLIFPLAGVAADMRRTGRVHRAWLCGLAAMAATFALTEGLTYSSTGAAIYRAVTAGSPGADIAPFDFASPPR